MESMTSQNKQNGYYIYRSSKTNKDGQKIYARDYGKRAFKIFVPAKHHK